MTHSKEHIRESLLTHLKTFQSIGLKDIMLPAQQAVTPTIKTAPVTKTDASTLNELQELIGNCQRCKLCEQRKNIVFGVGNPNADLMFIGEGPGADEDEQGIPFVGRAGKLLTKIIESMGYTRDEIYIANVVKCLRYNSMVQLEDSSWERIGRLVKSKYSGNVMSIDSEGKIVPKRVTGWHATPLSDRPVYKLSFKSAKRNIHQSKASIHLTGDHPVLTDRGYVAAQDLEQGDKIATGQGLSSVVKNVIYGTLLGDGHINKKNAHLSFTHSEKQADYAKFKSAIIQQDLKVSITEMKVAAGGEQKYPVIRCLTHAHRALWTIRNDFYENKKKVPENLANSLNPMMLAIWFMDDGYLRIRSPRQPSAEIATCSFQEDDIAVLINGLKKMGIAAYQLRGRIHFDVKASKKLSETIAPYVPPSMRYKLHPEIALRIPFNKSLYKPLQKETMFDEVEAELITHEGTDKTFYCIDVEDTNNFVTSGGVVHNCRPPKNRNPEPDEIETCMPFLKQQIQIIKPKVVMCLGKFAAQTVLDSQITISKLRGNFYEVDGIQVMPAFHPAYLLRNPSMKKPMWEDCKKVMKKIKELS